VNRHDAAAFAARNRNTVYDAVIGAIEHAAATQGLTQKVIAENIGRKPSQISTWLAGPSNWTLDTVSDLLYGAGATMEYKVVFNSDQPKSNVFNSASTLPFTLSFGAPSSYAQSAIVNYAPSTITSSNSSVTAITINPIKQPA